LVENCWAARVAAGDAVRVMKRDRIDSPLARTRALRLGNSWDPRPDPLP